MPSRLSGGAPADVGGHLDRHRSKPWRRWYNTARWQSLRLDRLLIDAEDFAERLDLVPVGEWPLFKRSAQFQSYPLHWPVCQKTGVLLVGGRDKPNSAVVDHIQPHRGNPDLFWDINNLTTVSKLYHDSTKQRIERRMV